MSPVQAHFCLHHSSLLQETWECESDQYLGFVQKKEQQNTGPLPEELGFILGKPGVVAEGSLGNI